MHIARCRKPLWILAALAVHSAIGGAAAPPALVFSTYGGEAWTFQKRIELVVADGACDEVVLVSPAAALVERPRSGRVAASVPLIAGENAISAECLRAGIRRGEAIAQHWRVRLRDVPKAHVQAIVGDGAITFDASASEPAESRPTPIKAYDWRSANDNPAPLPIVADGARATARIPAADGDYHVSVTITDELGRTDRAAVMLHVRGGQARPTAPPQGAPAWIDGAVVYGVMASAFDPPRLAAVAAKLDGLKALGITTLWLSPVTASAPADFGYAVTNHFALREDAGTEAHLRMLVQAAHARGMRVILDFVPNHLSDRHPYYEDADRNGRTSPYYDFFARTSSGEAAHYFDWSNLKNLNYANPEVQRMMIEAFAYWVRELDVDGFRVDAAWGPRERAPEFWPRVTQELRRIKPDLLLLAEASAHDGRYYMHSGFDAAYDWTDRLGVWAWGEAFSGAGNVAHQLRLALTRHSEEQIRVFRFLNNNDTGARFVTRHGAAMTRVAATLLLTLPGIPGLYTGDEVGAEFEPYNQREPIRWGDAHGLRDWYAALLRLRSTLPALRSGALRLLDAGKASEVLAYVRPGQQPQDDVLVFLNFAAEPIEVSLPAGWGQSATGSKLVDLLSGAALADARGRIRLIGHSARIIQVR